MKRSIWRRLKAIALNSDSYGRCQICRDTFNWRNPFIVDYPPDSQTGGGIGCICDECAAATPLAEQVKYYERERDEKVNNMMMRNVHLPPSLFEQVIAATKDIDRDFAFVIEEVLAGRGRPFGGK